MVLQPPLARAAGLRRKDGGGLDVIGFSSSGQAPACPVYSYNVSMLKKYLLLFFCLAVITSCSREVARVGDIPVKEKDLQLRAEVSEIYYPQSGERHVALAQLVNGYLSVIALESLGYEVTSAILEEEAKRIQEKTKAPDVLKRIKDVYGWDHGSYRRTFVRVVYAERMLYEVFLSSKEIHREEHQKAEDFLAAVRARPGDFGAIAQGRGLKTFRLRLSLSKGIMLYGRQNEEARRGDVQQAQRILESLSTRKKGGLSREVLEWPEGYQVARFLRQEGEDCIVESAVLPKKDFTKWFWDRASMIPVRIPDDVLRNELLHKVSWAKNLKLNE